MIHLRQVCLVAGALAPAVSALRDVLGLPVAHVDPAVGKFGLENTLLTLGSQFLEVVAPTRAGTAAGRYLDRRGGDGGYMVICQAGDRDAQDAVRANARAAAVREAYFSDRGTWNVCQFHPGDMRATFLEVDWDAQGEVAGNWMPAGGLEWQAAGAAPGAITAVEIQGDDPAALAAHWARVLGTQAEGPEAAPTVALGNATLRFVADSDGRGPGLGGLDLRLPDPEAARLRVDAAGFGHPEGALICGTRFRFLAA